jgi:biotin carboxylase
MMNSARLVFVESNTSGTGRLFARAAAKQGMTPVLLAADVRKYSYAIEDGLEVIAVDTQRIESVLEVCKQLANESEIAGVTSSSEYFIEMATTTAQELSLPGPRPAAIGLCRDKRKQRTCLREAGVSVPAFRSACTREAAIRAADEIGLPVVVKPVSGSGSVGVRLCDNINQVASHSEALLSQRTNERGAPVPGCVLVEEVAIGSEYSVETFDQEIIGITQKHLGPLPHFVETGHDFPGPVPEGTETSIGRTVLSSLKALGLTWGPAHTELRITETGPKIIEVNPRLAGGYIPEIVRLAHGIDLVAETVRAVSGMQARLVKQADQYASLRFVLLDVHGTLSVVQGLDDARSISGIESVIIYAHPGDHLQPRGDFRDRFGHVIAVAESVEAACEAAESARSKIRLTIGPA